MAQITSVLIKKQVKEQPYVILGVKNRVLSETSRQAFFA
jgi:hypothetical protein